MHFHRLTHAVDVHAAGWPLRVLALPSALHSGFSLAETAERLWHGDHPHPSPIRWLLQEPRGHAAMRIGVIGPSASPSADVSLLVFDARGPCPPDGLDALCAAAAMDEMGFISAAGEAKSPAGGVRTIQTDQCLLEVRRKKEGSATYAAVSGDQPSTITERGRQVWTGRMTLTCDVVQSGGQIYAVFDAQECGLRLTIESIAGLEEAAREILEVLPASMRIAMWEGGPGRDGMLRTAGFGADGKLFRMTESRALGAILAILSEGGGGPAPRRIAARGLSGGTVICREAARLTGNSGAAAREFLCRPFVTGSLQFVMDPDDELGEGFLLR